MRKGLKEEEELLKELEEGIASLEMGKICNPKVIKIKQEKKRVKKEKRVEYHIIKYKKEEKTKV